MSQTAPRVVLAIDPGTAKAGLALVREDGRVLERSIVPIAQIAAVAARAARTYPLAAVLLGDGTGRESIRQIIAQSLPGVEVRIVSERDSTLQARKAYFAHNPARGWRRLLPAGLRVPPAPYDDFVAVVLAQRFFAERDHAR